MFKPPLSMAALLQASPPDADIRLSQVPLASVSLSSADPVQVIFTDGTGAEVPPDLSLTSATYMAFLHRQAIALADFAGGDPPPVRRRRHRLQLPLRSHTLPHYPFSACSPVCPLSMTFASFVFVCVH